MTKIWKQLLQIIRLFVKNMEDGGVDTTVIESRQHKFLTHKTWWTSYWISDHATGIDEFSFHNFILKMCGPIIENEYLWVYTKFMCLHISVKNEIKTTLLYYSIFSVWKWRFKARCWYLRKWRIFKRSRLSVYLSSHTFYSRRAGARAKGELISEGILTFPLLICTWLFLNQVVKIKLDKLDF